MAKRGRAKSSNYWGAFILEWFFYLQDSDLSSSDYKILFYLCGILKHEDNIAYVKQKQIAENLMMDKGNVSKSIKKLVEKQFIAKSDNGFMINPHLFYVGKRSPETRFFIRDEFDALISGDRRFNLNEDENKLELNPDNKFEPSSDLDWMRVD